MQHNRLSSVLNIWT